MVTIDNLNYDPWAPGLGTISGTYTYRFSYWLSDDGYLKNIRWNVISSDLINDDGNKVIIVDSGHDNLANLWIWFNYPNYLNESSGCPEITYDVTDGWLDEYMPPVMPVEGVSVEMSCKIVCKGVIFRIQFMAVVKINANGDMTVSFIKP